MAEQKPPRKRLGEILVDMGLITQDQVDAALKVQKKDGGLLGAVLIRLQFVSESDIAIALAKQNAIPYVCVMNCEINTAILKLLDGPFAHKNRCVPFDRIGNVLLLACADPTQQYAITDVEEKTGLKVQVYIGLEGEIRNAIQKHYKITEQA